MWRWERRNLYITPWTCLVLMWQKNVLLLRVGVLFLEQNWYSSPSITSASSELFSYDIQVTSFIQILKHVWLDFCRSRMHCRGHHLTLTPKLEQFSRFCKQRNYHLPIFGQTNSLLLSKKLLMHMGGYLSNTVFTSTILMVENCCWWLKDVEWMLSACLHKCL